MENHGWRDILGDHGRVCVCEGDLIRNETPALKLGFSRFPTDVVSQNVVGNPDLTSGLVPASAMALLGWAVKMASPSTATRAEKLNAAY